MLVQQPWLQIGSLAFYRPTPHLLRMPDPITRLNAALEGRYAIERELGEGGMATVYLADDLKHERKVALKVLKPELAAVVGAERFLAEIKTTANLTRPHILPLHDSGEADSFLFYVMPYIEGETLQDRIDREKQLPVDEAVRIAIAVANALQTAHDQGIIHRDIKPANILLSRGEPLISDFGIALAVGAAGSNRLTETGLSLGTPYYMSPEQATGDQAVGASTDTYALGSVLYEMLVGDPPYPGSTAQAVLGKILAGKPVSATEQRPSVPANVDAAVRKALEKLPADRFTSAQDFVRALGDKHFQYGQVSTAGAAAAVGPWKRLSIAATTLAALLAGVAAWALLRSAPPGPVTRVSVLVPEDQSYVGGDLDLSRDGSLMVYTGRGDDVVSTQLWARPWNALDATPIRNTDGGRSPAISPDDQEVAFRTGTSIRVVSLQGGVSRTLAEGLVCCPAWSPDGEWLYYSDEFAGLRRIPATGGEPEIVTQVGVAAGDATDVHVELDVLPGGRGAVYMVRGVSGFRLQAVDLVTGEVKELMPGRYPRYSVTGHLLFLDDDGTLFSVPFDADELEVTGAPIPIVRGVAMGGTGAGFYAVSEDGGLVYRTGSGASALRPVWVERDGTAREIDPSWRIQGRQNWTSLALSPDESRLAVSIPDSDGAYDLWVKQLDTGPLIRLTFEGALNYRASWSVDGQSLTFVSDRDGPSHDVVTKRADGSGTAELVLDRERLIREGSYSPDETWLVFREGPGAQGDISALRPGVDTVPMPLVVTEFGERSPTLSPNGRWLAYVSSESGRQEVGQVPICV